MSPSDRLSLLVLNAIDAVGVVVIVLVALTFLFLAWGYVMGSIILACEWLGRQSRELSPKVGDGGDQAAA
jgi:hypothetical protein